LLVQIADKRSLQPWPLYQVFESKFDRHSNFETPVDVFILQVELYVVTRGLAIVGKIQQSEPIKNVLVDGMFGYLIAAVTESETSLSRGGPRGECIAFLRKD
jgi:hypothetical protein